ncbi:TIL domain-containing protein [Caenorhabditis elegans]|uniref:TIL domain-containing protein n=1 Tax=Caenorhabditis elegans TaxID=6239 RepID=Q18159_CAEEL|nr:TIL domain-containing protein [Caenorhabditis elegans]CCD65656.1 TIL domain-containing protein [Caenorhabditis elegans]|eukprot:NP_505347.1 Uncharacterized protein CELE_C25E10.10 [Caenorhabditis elegans]
MNFQLFIFFALLAFARSGVLKNTENMPISHTDALCGSIKCPDNYRCELPVSDLECGSEDDCSVDPKCVPIPIRKPECEGDEELKACGSACEPTCDNENPECDLVCMTNVCQCKKGLVRDSATGKCVEKNKCSKCTLECSENEKCELVELTCEEKPCQIVDVCVAQHTTE